MSVGPRHHIALVAAAVTLGASVVAAPAGGQPGPPGSQPADRAYYVLPPGNYGGLPTTDESRDQIPLYDALTPLRGDVTDADIDAHFLPEDFSPVGATREEPTGRPGTTILYDEYGVAHISGRTRADLAFGAGWVTARDRGLLLQLGRGPARAAVADIPGIDAFGLVTSGQSFVPSAATEQLVSDQVDLLVEIYGDKGRQIIADAQAEADGINAYWAAHGIDQPPATVNDVVAVTAFIGSIFGGGGGAEAANAELLATLRAGLGPEVGTQAWEDAMLADDPEAPTTTRRRFNYGPRTGGRVTGSVVVDPGSIRSLDPRQPGPAAASPSESSAGRLDATYPAAGPVPSREASNFLVVDPKRSATGNTLAVMGPQLGYFYPEIVQQIHLSGPGIEAQGVAVPAAAMYILIGRTRDYAWSLTSANHDVRDVFAEQLCNPDGTPPTRASTHYVFEGTCRPFETFDAGTLNGTPVRYPLSVHGPVIGTATVGGEPHALTRQRSTFGRDALNLAALKDMTEGKADTSRQFFEAANQFEFTFNWAYASRTETAYFSSGFLPRRARGLDRRLPTLGTGDYEWRGFLSQREHPHDVRGPGDLLLNWNNRSAPGFMHGDDAPFGSAHRVELFDQWPRDPTLADTVSVMNRAATEDVRSLVWPVVSRVLRSGDAPSALADRTVAVLDDWVARDAPRLDADLDGDYDDAGPVISDALWQPIADAVMRPVYGDLTDDLADVRSLNGAAGQSYVDKDLRALLGDPVKGRFNLSYCGGGSLDACRASLWAVVEQVAGELTAEQGPEPSSWTGPAARTGFTPGLIPDTIRTTNRPTFQQVLELAGEPRSVR
ncbi:MAG: penicillin acylase family protein [Acidimicrobiales bacterium]